MHDGHQNFHGSSEELNWESLDQQDGSSWDNTAFKEQNAFEAQANFVGSLETTEAGNVAIGADGNQTAWDGPPDEKTDMMGTEFQ